MWCFARKSDYGTRCFRVSFFCVIALNGSDSMPTTKPQKLIFAVLTVIITVHLFVFYNLAIEMGGGHV